MFKKLIMKNETQRNPTLTVRDALELVRDTASREWQEKDGTRKSAIDNQGRRMWFISADVMDEVRLALATEDTQ